MKLEMGNFYVKDVIFGDSTSYSSGILTINKGEALAFIKEAESHITDVDLIIAKPGDDVRIVPVKEAIEPRVRPDGRTLFPGITGDVTSAGEGRLHALKGCSVLAVGKHWGSFGDGMIDMKSGAKYTYFSKLINICMVADTDEEFERYEQQKKNKALRWAAHKLAEYIGSAVKNLEPEELEIFELDSIIKRDEKTNKLPAVVLVMQPQSQMEELGYNDMIYGWDMNKYVPTFMSPTEVLDGAIISGSFMPASSKWSTYDMQNFPTIRELFKEHGKTINFLGVIMSNLNVSLEQKERSATFVAQIAKSLGADGAIVTEEGYGNPDADYIRCIVALEDAGVKVIGISNECTGRDGASQPLVTLDKKADALVSTGNVSELIELPPAATVIGELQALARDGLSGGWSYDEFLGSSVREDGSVILENNAMFCGDQIVGWSTKTMKEF
ncbi:MAG: glycine/sarcosine/betaine reductase component B subunit [Proteocatella sp.]